ncbi:hypothetical protein LTR86_009008 [Recurvomyces mirabilis]|nr:hypothetical protein LTR86_009008 [Recurvomyces mirabilis]
MAERIPEILLTNPSNQDSAPSPAQSPIKDNDIRFSNITDSRAGAASGRPVTPVSKSGRPDSANGSARPSTSPSRRFRRPSTNASSVISSSTQYDRAETTSQEAQATMDPLSQHLMRRTNGAMSVPSPNGRPNSRGGSPSKDRPSSKEPSPAPPARNLEPLSRTSTSETAVKDLRKGVKAVSFLSKLMGGAKKQGPAEAIAEEQALEEDEDRPEGTEAQVFAQPVDNVGFSPRHPQPPGYIKVRSKNKQKRDFDRLFLAQELESRNVPKLERRSSKLVRKQTIVPDGSHTVWAMEFSKDGKYLATAGADKIVRVWAVLSSSDDRGKHEKQEAMDDQPNSAGAHPQHVSAPVFHSRPIKEFRGHTSTILDLSWSKNNFLLSSSMDKTVRLWHTSRDECLCTFKHNDFVPSIAFHPKDDRFFLAGSLDHKLRLWSIPDKSVAYAAQVPDMITAVTFTPDGKYAMAGTVGSVVMFFETEGLKYSSQMHVRSTRGQNAKGSKITSLHTAYSRNGDVKLLVTSNDSRIRLYNFRDKSLELKLKGNENNCSQIRATLSECGRYVSCGSEDRRAYIWSLHSTESDQRDKRPFESFEAHSTITTAVCMAPAKTRSLLSKSEDPIYDLCNPPPITLMSRAERAESQASSRPSSIIHTPIDQDSRAMPSPAYMTRSGHQDGNIIVTADFTGKIKVFRQDCAWNKRKTDDWDRASMFSKRAGRPGSLATRASQRSLREGRPSVSTQPSSERIMTWRQGVASTPALANNGARRNSSKHTSRSGSPGKSLVDAKDFTASMGTAHANGAAKSKETAGTPLKHSDTNPLLISGGQSYAFYDTNQYVENAERLRRLHEQNPSLALSRQNTTGGASVNDEHHDHHLAVRPPHNRDASYVSRLSDERSSGNNTDDDEEVFEEAREGRRFERDQRCGFCGSRSFKVEHSPTRPCCAGCGRTAAIVA